MKRKFEILQHENLSQIQMWLNQKNTVKGQVKIESNFQYIGGLYILLISYND